MDRPSNSQLRSWRFTKLIELLKFIAKTPSSKRGTPQRKVRWRRAEQLAVAKHNRASRRRAKTRITKTIQRRRLAKGRDIRNG